MPFSYASGHVHMSFETHITRRLHQEMFRVHLNIYLCRSGWRTFVKTWTYSDTALHSSWRGHQSQKQITKASSCFPFPYAAKQPKHKVTHSADSAGTRPGRKIYAENTMSNLKWIQLSKWSPSQTVGTVDPFALDTFHAPNTASLRQAETKTRAPKSMQ